MSNRPLSLELRKWLKEDKPKNLAGLIAVFGEKSIVIVILVLLFFPALPLPTGGITHILELAAMILALEMIAGRKTIWLPKKILKMNLGQVTLKKAIPFFTDRISWLEKHSKPWGRGYLENPYFLRFVGVLLLVLAINTFVAPPFTGLDTLPSFSAVLISIGVILGDMRYFVIGLVIGIAGLASYVFLGAVVIEVIKNLIHRLF